MAVQFHCPSCRQPIEVDDEWASMHVACPFCRKTVAATATSTYQPPLSIPTATPLVTGPLLTESGRAAGGRAADTLAVVAFALSCLWVLGCVASAMVMVPAVVGAVGEDATPQEVQKYLEEQVESRTPPAWMMAGTAALLAAGVFWISGLVCGILGLPSRRRRGFVIATFILLAAGPVLMCVGLSAGG